MIKFLLRILTKCVMAIGGIVILSTIIILALIALSFLPGQLEGSLFDMYRPLM